jgi:hypothetical protein
VIEAAVAFAAAISVAAYFTATAGRGQLTWIPEPSQQVVRHVFARASGDNLVLRLGVVAGLVLLADRARRNLPAARWRLALIGGWIVLPLGLGIVVSFLQPILVARYAIVITPGLALAAAVPFTTLWRRWPAVALLGLVAVLAGSAIQIGHWYGEQREDWRSAVAYVARERGPEDDTIVVPVTRLEGLRFYDGATDVSYRPVRRRTFIYVWGGRDAAAENLRTAIGPVAVRTISEQQFGSDLRVRVVEPVP